jgi:hypothetical protein
LPLRLAIFVAVVIDIAITQAWAQPASVRETIVSSCRYGCQQQGATPAVCSLYCDCVRSEVESKFSREALMARAPTLSPDQQRLVNEITVTCVGRIRGQ